MGGSAAMNIRPDPRVLDEVELAFRCAERPVDQEAWLEFWGRYRFAIRGAVSSVLQGNSQREIDDGVQNAFLKIFPALAHFDPNRGPLLPFIRQVARNAVLDSKRGERRHAEVTVPLSDEIAAAMTSAPMTITPDRLATAIDAELRTVKKVRRLKAYRLLLDGADMESVGRQLGVSPAGVYRLRRECVELVRLGIARHFQTEY